MFASIKRRSCRRGPPGTARAPKRAEHETTRRDRMLSPLRNATERRCHGPCPIVPAHPPRKRTAPACARQAFRGRWAPPSQSPRLLARLPAALARCTRSRRLSARRPPRRRRTSPPSRPIQSIVALVNDEPITGYEIEQRVALSMLGAPDVQQQAAGQAQVAEHERAVQELRHEAAAGQSAEDGSRAAGAREAVAGRVRRQHQSRRSRKSTCRPRASRRSRSSSRSASSCRRPRS